MTFVALDVTVEDLGVHFGKSVVLDDDRASHFLDLATAEVAQIMNPPSNACKGVILDAAARAYMAPVPIATETTGPYSRGGLAGGVSLTRTERRRVRRIASGGSAFTIPMIGADAGSGLQRWDYTDTGDITPDDVA